MVVDDKAELVAPTEELEPAAGVRVKSLDLPSDPIVVLLSILVALAVLCVAYLAAEIVLPIVLALVLKLLFQPGMRLLEKLRLPRSLAALVLILLVFGAIVGIGAAISGPATEWAAKLPEGIPRLQERLKFLNEPVEALQTFLHKVDGFLQQGSGSNAGSGSAIAASLFAGTTHFAASFFETIVILFFLLVSGSTFLRRMVEMRVRADASDRKNVDIEGALIELERRRPGRICVGSALAALLADYADLKLPADFMTSRRVAEVAALTASVLGFDAETTRRLTTAALLHGLGRVAVPNGTLERRGPISEADEEHIRLVPHWTERILKRASVFENEAKLASRAFERLDGSGYPRGLIAHNLDPCARVLQACVFVVDVSKPEREASGTPGASAIIMREVRSGRLDADATNAVLIACGMPRKTIAAHPAAAPQQITQREQEVLAHLARGRSNKEIARALGISPSTTGTHVENIYRKLGVGTRAAAALIASKQGLVV